MFNLLEDIRKDILPNIGGHHRNIPGAAAAGGALAHIGAAALAAAEQPLLLQKADGLAHRLAAAALLTGQGQFPGQPRPFGIYPFLDLFPQQGGQL